jgi:N-formylglutamate deformylase
MSDNYTFIKGTSPLVSTAIHDGHHTREELMDIFNLNDQERLREEDPFTAKWLNASDNKVIVHNSRFETDVNRPRDKAVYKNPEDAWGLKVWKDGLPEDVYQNSLRVYDDFYRAAKEYFDELFTHHEKLIVYDIHTYNHRREGADIEADPEANPEVNLGTKNMDRELWEPVVQEVINQFRDFNYNGRNLDTRENVKFTGGYFGQWLYEQYGSKICPISIEFKKFFMDEHTGKGFEEDIKLIDQMLRVSAPSVLKAMEKVNP